MARWSEGLGVVFMGMGGLVAGIGTGFALLSGVAAVSGISGYLAGFIGGCTLVAGGKLAKATVLPMFHLTVAAAQGFGHGLKVANALRKGEEPPVHKTSLLSQCMGMDILQNWKQDAVAWGRALVLQGADLSVRNDLGETPVFVMKRHCDVTTLRAMIRRGADVDVADKSGRAFKSSIYSVWRGDDMQHEALYIIKTKNTEKTPDSMGYALIDLMRSGTGNWHTLESLALIRQGANVNLRTFSSEETPLMMAMRFGDNAPELIRALIEHGADTEIKDRFKYSAADHAYDRPIVLKLLNNAPAIKAAAIKKKFQEASDRGTAKARRIRRRQPPASLKREI